MHVALVAKIMSDPSLYEIVTLDQLAMQTPGALELTPATAAAIA